MIVGNIFKEDAESGKFLHLASTIANFLSDSIVQGFQAKRDTVISDLVDTCMNGVCDVLAEAE